MLTEDLEGAFPLLNAIREHNKNMHHPFAQQSVEVQTLLFLRRQKFSGSTR